MGSDIREIKIATATARHANIFARLIYAVRQKIYRQKAKCFNIIFFDNLNNQYVKMFLNLN